MISHPEKIKKRRKHCDTASLPRKRNQTKDGVFAGMVDSKKSNGDREWR
jgi:hypothetical protein